MTHGALTAVPASIGAAGQPVLALRRVTRQFGARVALLDVTLELQPGLVGLLGPNGAGKTTLLNLAAGLALPSSGTVTWAGGMPRHSRALDNRVAFASDGDPLPHHTTPQRIVAELLRCAGLGTAAANGRARDTLVRLGLAAQLDSPLGGLSRGQRQRVKLAQAFALPAALILLDEPLNALDPVWRLEVAALMQEAVRGGACVVLSSHILEEVEALATWLVLLFRGRLVATGTRREIQDLLRNRATALRVTCSDPRALGRELLARAPVTVLRVEADALTLHAEDVGQLYRALPAAVVATQVRVASVTTDGDDLISLFRALSAEVR